MGLKFCFFGMLFGLILFRRISLVTMFTQRLTGPQEHQHLLQIIAERDEELQSLRNKLKDQACYHFS
jgi:hypothetical protein